MNNNMNGMLGRIPQDQPQGGDQSMAGMLGIGGGQQNMGGMLGNLPGGGQMQAPPAQGMPQGAPTQQQAQGGDPQQGLKLAMQLSQNPTQQTAQMIIQQLKQSGNPDADQFEQLLSSAQGDPATLKKMADAVIQQLSGGQQ